MRGPDGPEGMVKPQVTTAVAVARAHEEIADEQLERGDPRAAIAIANAQLAWAIAAGHVVQWAKEPGSSRSRVLHPTG